MGHTAVRERPPHLLVHRRYLRLGRAIIRESGRRGMGIAVLSFAIGIAITFCSMLPNPIGDTVIALTPIATSTLWWLASDEAEEPPLSLESLS